jgi:hypothetical protein
MTGIRNQIRRGFQRMDPMSSGGADAGCQAQGRGSGVV